MALFWEEKSSDAFVPVDSWGRRRLTITAVGPIEHHAIVRLDAKKKQTKATDKPLATKKRRNRKRKL
mgnify:CR=1 FL=1